MSGELSPDLVERAKAALEHPCPCSTPGCKKPNPRELARLVPELVALIKQLESENARLRERADKASPAGAQS